MVLTVSSGRKSLSNSRSKKSQAFCPAAERFSAPPFGVAAVDLIAAGGFGMMVALHGDSIVSVDVAHAIGHLKSVDPKGELVRTARGIGIGFGD
jgi:6-phosphofructokinase 1